MTTENIQINIREDGSRVVIVNINNIADSAEAAANKITGLNQAMELLKKAWNAVSGLASKFLELADAVTLYESRLKIVTKSQENFNASLEAVYQISQRNNASLKETSNLYVKAFDPIKRLGGGVKETAAVVEGFTASLRISGASAGETASAILQFSQALASGRLQGDEFRSLAENAPRFMQVLADSLGVTTGELKGLSTQGKLTADVLANALLKNLESLRKEATQVADTFGGSMTRLQNDIMRTVGDFDKLYGVSKTAAEGVSGVSAIVAQLGEIFKSELKDGLNDAKSGFDVLGFTISSLGPILETFLLFGSDVLAFIKGIGRDVGGLAAMAVAAAKGDFAGVAAIGRAMEEDHKKAYSDLVRWQEKVSKLTENALTQRDKMKNGGDESLDFQTLKTTANEKDLYDVRLRLTGITKNYMNDLSTLQKQLEDNKISTSEYTELVSELAEKTWDSSAAGRAAAQAAKAGDVRVKVLKEGLLVEEGAFKEQEDLYKKRMEMINTYHKDFDTSDEDFYAQQKAARGEFLAWEAGSYQRQLDVINNFAAKTPKEVEDKKAYYLKLKIEHEEYLRQYAAAETKSQLDQLARDKDIVESSNDVTNKYISSLNAQAAALEKANAGREESRSSVERETVAMLDNAIAYQQQFMALQALDGATEEEMAQAPVVLKYLEDMRAARSRIADAMEVKESDAFAKKAADQAIKDWQRAGNSISDSLSKAFGKGGKAIGEMFKAYSIGVAGQLKAQEDLAAARKLSDDDPQKIDAINRAKLAGAQAELKSYGDITSAAQNYFDEGSRGYKALAAASNVLRAAEVALSVIKGINAVLTQGEGDPYTAFARMAAMAALVAGLGVALNGGGTSAASVSETRQKEVGTGSILGDKDAKSGSIMNALSNIDKNSGLGLVHFSSMDKSLQTLVAGISGLSSLLIRGTNLTSKVPGATKGSIESLQNNISLGEKLTGGAMGKLWGSIFGGKKTVEDVGLMIGKGSLATLLQGVEAFQYTDIKKKGGWFSSSKNYTETDSLGSEINNQFTMILQSLTDTVKAGAGILGISGTEFENKLNSFVVDIEKISTKDMTGDEIQTALENAFSKLGDDMAKFAVEGLDNFQKVGEGYLETLARVANELVQVQDVFAVLGKTFTATGVDAVKTSQNLIAAFGSVDKLTDATKTFVDSMMTDAEKLAPVQASLAAELTRLNLSTSLSAEEYKKLVLAQDLNTTGGQELFAALLNLAPAIKQVTDAEKKLADTRFDLTLQILELEGRGTEALALQRQKELAAMEASMRPLQERINLLTDERKAVSDTLDILKASIDKAKNEAKASFDAQSAILTAQKTSAQEIFENTKDTLQASIDAANKSIQNLTALQNSLKSAMDTLRQTVNPQQTLIAARQQITDALKVAKTTGVLPKSEDLQKSLQIAANPSTDNFNSFNEYQASLARTNNDLYQLSQLTGSQLSDNEKLLNASKSQLDLAQAAYDLQVKQFQDAQDRLQEQYDNEITRLDGIYEENQRAVNAILGLNVATLSVSDAITLLNGNIMKLATSLNQSNIPVTSTGPVEQTTAKAQLENLYQTILGRSSDKEGFEFWMKALNSGMSLSSVAAQFYTSAEYAATGGKPPTASAAVIQGGNSANKTASSASVGSYSASASNDRLAIAIENQNVILSNIAASTEKTKDLIDNVTAGGSAMAVE